MAALAFAGAFVAGAAHASPAPPHVVTEDTQRVVLADSLDVLEDADGALSFDDVLTPEVAARFTRFSGATPNFGFTSSAYWLRASVTGDHPGVHTWHLQIGYPLLDRVDVFVERSDGSFDHHAVGDQLLFEQRPIVPPDFVIPIRTHEGYTHRVFVRAESASSLQVPLVLWAPDALARTDRTSHLWLGMFYGVTLVMILYNLVLAVTLRDASHLYFCGFALAYLPVQAGLDGILYQYILPTWPKLHDVAIPLAICISATTALQFSRRFMDLPRTLPRIDRAALGFMAISVVLACVAIVAPYAVAIRLAAGFAFVASIGMFYWGLRARAAGVKAARFYVVAWAAFLLGTMMLVLSRFGLLPTNIFTTNGPKLGFIGDVIFLSLALGDRINSMQAEKEQAQRRALAEQARAAGLQESDVQKTRFIQNVSHELRTPLTLILTPLDELAARPELAGDPNLDVAQRNARRLLRLVNELLDFQKLTAGKRDLRLQPVELSSFVDACAQYVAPTCEQVGIELELRKPARGEVIVEAEPDALEKIVFNFLSNALRFTPRGGRIQLALELERGDARRARLAVTDSGPGISKEEQRRLFQVFSQVEGSTAARGKGTGLGLALAKELAIALSGEVGVDSAPGRGSTFWIALPLAADATIEAPAYTVEGDHLDEVVEADTGGLDLDIDGPPDAPLALIVDDVAEMRDLIRNLVGAAYRTATAADGVRGLALARMVRPDIIVSDWMMPRMDGPALVGAVRNDPELARTPFVLLTAKSDDESRATGAEIGADAFLGKPFNERELMSTLRNLLALKSREREVERLARDLAAERDALARIQQDKDELTRFIVHDLKNPLTVVGANLELLLDSAHVTEDDRESVTASLAATESLMRLVMDLLDVSRSEEGKLVARASELPLADVFRDVEQRMRRWLQQSGHQLRVSCEPGTARADRALLIRVLENLIDNAAKYSPPGAVELEVARDDGRAIIRVVDHGCAIPPDQRERIFDKYHRLAGSGGDAAARTSRGLGLVFCRMAARAHGGDVWVEEAPGGGNVFCVALPL